MARIFADLSQESWSAMEGPPTPIDTDGAGASPTGAPLAVCGMGLATALGADLESNWEKASTGTSGTRPLDGFSHRGKLLPVGRCPDADLARALEAAGLQAQAGAQRVVSLAECVAAQALRGAPAADPERTGVYFGSSLTTADYVDAMYERYYERKQRTPPSALVDGMSCSIASEVASRLGLRGPVCTVSTSCSSALQALQVASRDVRAGAVDAALVIGADSCFARSYLELWANARVLSFLEPAATAGRPFCASRHGMVYAEGAAAVLLRRASESRGGLRYLGGAVRHDPDGKIATSKLPVLSCLRAALGDAGVPADRVDFVEANASGAHLDQVEAEALGELVGRRAPVRAVKALLGSPLGAAGLVSLVHALLAMEHHRLPGASNVVEQDPAIGQLIDCYHLGRDLPRAPVALVDCFGFGGTNAAAVVALAEEGR